MGALNVAGTGIIAFSKAMQMTSHNIANVQDELMFSFDRKQFDGNDNLIEEFSNAGSIGDAISSIDRFIDSNDRAELNILKQAHQQVLVDLTKVGLRMQQLDKAQEVVSQKLLRYQEIANMNSEADLTELATKLAELRTQQEAVYKSTALVQNMSLFNYL